MHNTPREIRQKRDFNIAERWEDQVQICSREGVENEVRIHGLLGNKQVKNMREEDFGNKQVKNMREEDFCCRLFGHWMEHTPPAHHT